MTRVREVEDEDLEAVARLTREQGWSEPTPRDWQHLWRENPALEGIGPVSRGWVLLHGTTVVGFVNNIAQSYQFGTRKLLAAIASGMIVAPPFRGSSLQLMVAFTRQPNVDLLFNTTAAAHVSRISEFLKFSRIPQPDYNRSFYWVLRPVTFAAAALRKKGYAAISRPASVVLAPLLWLEGTLRRRGSAGLDRHVDIRTIRSSAIGPEFENLWQRRLAESPKLFAVRNARTLRWHFAARGRPTPPLMVCAYRGSELTGYVAQVRQDSPHLGLTRACVADIFVERDDPQTILALLRRAMVEAQRGGASMLEVVGFPAAIRRALRTLRPFELVNESWPFLYKTADPALQRELSEEAFWHASLFDGDGSL